MILRYVCSFFLITFFVGVLSEISADQKQSAVSEVWGRAVKVTKGQAFHGYRYFIYYTIDNQQYAYPIAVKNKQQQKIIEQFENKLIKVSGSVYSRKIISDGPPVQMAYFVPDTIAPVTLETLNINNKNSQSTQRPEMVSTTRAIMGPEGGIRISDPAAEVSVYTAAALILGNMIKDYLSRK
ncbi:MAG: hypothetical protein HYV97_14760 [Bdellovibrio sp.]|nr:hypothetical protein [Bdellovibrio sp.]